MSCLCYEKCNVFTPPRPLDEIDAELKGCTDKILTMIGGLSK